MLSFFKSGFNKIKTALTKSRSALGDRLKDLFSKKISDDSFDELEEVLYQADLGTKIALDLTEKIRVFTQQNNSATQEELLNVVREELLKLCPTDDKPKFEAHPLVFLIVGVNGNGKTTSVAKLAKFYKEMGKKVLIGAADTFRAAAIEQLTTWATRVGVDIVKSSPGSDPSSVAFDTVTAGLARKSDVIIIDTAGRLHTKTPLMQELQKMRKVLDRVLPGAPHETFLILDATTGQNAIDQAKTFNEYTPISGIILTKLDGSAKGGIVFAIQKELSIPVKFLGVGEGMDDLQNFDAKSFISAIVD